MPERAGSSGRLAEMGRVRLGVKDNTKQGRHSIETFRFTSPNKTAIEQLATRYGGQVQPWTDPKAKVKDQWEVITQAKRIPIIVPPDSLSNWYELWTGGGIARRCDGETCQMTVNSEPVEVPCVCDRKGKLECREVTRFTMIIPEVVFGGTWRLDTKGVNAAIEMSAMIDFVEGLMQMNGGSFVQGELVVEKRYETKNGRKQEYVVPRFELKTSVAELAAGGGTIQALARGDNLATPELGTGGTEYDGADMTWESKELTATDIEVIEDAEVIEDDLSLAGDPAAQDALLKRARGDVDLYAKYLVDIDAGRAIFAGIDADGKAILKKGPKA